MSFVRGILRDLHTLSGCGVVGDDAGVGQLASHQERQAIPVREAAVGVRN